VSEELSEAEVEHGEWPNLDSPDLIKPIGHGDSDGSKPEELPEEETPDRSNSCTAE